MRHAISPFGNLTGLTLALAEEPDSTNSPVAEFAHTLEQTEEGVFCCTAQTRYKAEEAALTKVEKQLIAQLSSTLAEKVISAEERGLTFSQWTAYNRRTKRTMYRSEPISGISEETGRACASILSRRGCANSLTRRVMRVRHRANEGIMALMAPSGRRALGYNGHGQQTAGRLTRFGASLHTRICVLICSPHIHKRMCRNKNVLCDGNLCVSEIRGGIPRLLDEADRGCVCGMGINHVRSFGIARL